MAFDALTGYAQVGFNWTAQKNGPTSSISFPATVNQNTINAKSSVVLGDNVANGANELACWIQTITASGTATIDLTSLTDILNFTGVALVRLKSFAFWLLGTADDATNGTACSSISIGNAGSNGNALDMGAVANTRTLLNGDWTAYGTRQAAGKTVDSTHKNVLITNNDGSNAAAVLIALFGATS